MKLHIRSILILIQFLITTSVADCLSVWDYIQVSPSPLNFPLKIYKPLRSLKSLASSSADSLKKGSLRPGISPYRKKYVVRLALAIPVAVKLIGQL